MQAAKLNLTIKQGATFRKRLVWRGSNKKPINLTGYTAKMQARSVYGNLKERVGSEGVPIILDAGALRTLGQGESLVSR